MGVLNSWGGAGLAAASPKKDAPEEAMALLGLRAENCGAGTDASSPGRISEAIEGLKAGIG